MENSPDQTPDTGTTRRRLLGGAAAVGLGAASLALPPNVRKAMAATPHGGGHGGLKAIKHVVMLMQENRSFDHYFGARSGVRGFEDPHAMRISNGRSLPLSNLIRPGRLLRCDIGRAALNDLTLLFPMALSTKY